MKILLAGDWHSQIHEEPAARALQTLGHTVVRFPWHIYFKWSSSLLNVWEKVSGKLQNKYLLGPRFHRVNQDLVRLVASEQPDAIFIYHGTHVTPITLRAIKRVCPRAILVGYNNDDPFSPRQPRWAWRHFVQAIPEYDLMLAYRHHNLEDYKRAGARRVELLRSWFVPEINHPVRLSPEDRARFECDVVFVGHNERDGRLGYMEEIARQGFRLRIFGPDYPKHLEASYLRSSSPIKAVRGEDYNKALCGAKIALCFLSKLNRDTYTRRCFEIPATKTFMLSEYTADLALLYREAVEAVFFRSKEELIDQLRFYLMHDNERCAIAEAGYQRVYADGHDVVSRMRAVTNWIVELRGGR